MLRWLPFIDGAQNCIGQQLATLETKLAVCIFVARFHLWRGAKLPCASVEELAACVSTHVTLNQSECADVQLQLRG